MEAVGVRRGRWCSQAGGTQEQRWRRKRPGARLGVGLGRVGIGRAQSQEPGFGPEQP